MIEHVTTRTGTAYRRRVNPAARNALLPVTIGPYSIARVLELGEAACRARGEQPTARNVALQLGVSRATVLAWRQGRRAGVSTTVADRAAIRCGAYLEDLR